MNGYKYQEDALCLVGTLVPEKWFNEIQAKSKEKAANSPVFMQTLIYKSLLCQNDNVSVFSYPPVASYPRGAVFYTRGRNMEIFEGHNAYIIPMVNLGILKQFTVFCSMFAVLFRWCIKNKGKNKNILTYADFLEYCIPALIVGHLFGAHVSVFLTEMPGYAHYHKGKVGLKDKVIIWSEDIRRKLHGRFDGYVFMSEHLNGVTNLNHKPWTVVEGFYDPKINEGIDEYSVQKEKKKTIMYAGSLGEAYNIKMLVDAFHELREDYQLWIFGHGKYAEYVEQMAQVDTRIKYFGPVPRSKVLIAEKKVHLLIHAKSPLDPYSKYAFSSKIFEYMASGTPMLTTVVGGIPKEYYAYSYVIEDASVEGIKKGIQSTLEHSELELEEMGKRAKSFIAKEKCQSAQAKKIIDMMHRI